MKTFWGRNYRARVWLLFGLLACAGLTGMALQYNQAVHQAQLNQDLLDAAAANQAVRVRELLRAGADPNIHLPSDTPSPSAWLRMTTTVVRLWHHQPPAPHEVPPTVLQVALGSQTRTGQAQTETVGALLNGGANPNGPKLLPSEWCSADAPLLMALNQSQPQIVRLLLDKRADAALRDQYGVSCLNIAAGGGWRGGQNAQSVALLLAHGVDANMRDTAGVTPLLAAAAATRISPTVIKLLLDHGAVVSAQGQDGVTALAKLTSYHRSLDRPEALAATTLLLAHGANVNARSVFGQTSLMLAVDGGQIVTARILIAHGADVSARDAKGRTALDRLRASDMGRANSYLKRDFIILLSKKPQ